MSTEMHHCGHCGARVQANDTHCMDCGEALFAAQPAPQPAPRVLPTPPPPDRIAESIGRAEIAIHEALGAEAAIADTGRGVLALCIVLGALDLVAAAVLSVGGYGVLLAISAIAAAVTMFAVGGFTSRLLHSASTILGAQASQTELLALLVKESRHDQ